MPSLCRTTAQLFGVVPVMSLQNGHPCHPGSFCHAASVPYACHLRTSRDTCAPLLAITAQDSMSANKRAAVGIQQAVTDSSWLPELLLFLIEVTVSS